MHMSHPAGSGCSSGPTCRLVTGRPFLDSDREEILFETDVIHVGMLSAVVPPGFATFSIRCCVNRCPSVGVLCSGGGLCLRCGCRRVVVLSSCRVLQVSVSQVLVELMLCARW